MNFCRWQILIERILQLADKMYKFIRINNIYGRAYDIKTKAFKFKGKTEDFDWRSAIKERISACDKVIAKKYVVDIFEDGKSELTAMLKVTWDAVFYPDVSTIEKVPMLTVLKKCKRHYYR